jgi:two-component system sensor histidine kinase YesM
MRYGDRLSVKWDVDPVATELKVVKFVLQPLVENALIHGIDRRRKKGFILIRIRIRDGLLELSVTDNGAGIGEAELSQIQDSLVTVQSDSHIGLRNIRQRLRLIYGEEATMTLRSRKGYWTQVRLDIPLKCD